METQIQINAYIKSISVGLFLSPSLIFAGSMGFGHPAEVSIPCASNAWGFGYQELSIQPDQGLLAVPGALQSNQFDVREYLSFAKQWNWGFNLEASYHAATDDDFNVNWYHINTSRTFYFSNALLLNQPTSGEFTYNPSWNQVNVEWGQNINMNEFKAVRIFGGMSYTGLKNSRTGVFQRVETSATSTSYQVSNFQGYGPRFGFDFQNHWQNGLGAYAFSAFSVLSGNKNFSFYPVGVYQGNSLHLSERTIVPEFEAKIGATYVCPLAQGSMLMNVGWMWVRYFNPHFSVNASRGLFGEIKNTEMGLQGLYFGLKWLGNVA